MVKKYQFNFRYIPPAENIADIVTKKIRYVFSF